jgi:hypothetical protein
MDSEKLFNEVVRTMSRWSTKGEKLLSTGVRLICPTPHVAPEAWLHVLFPPLSPSEIEAIEKNLGMLLPDDFKHFLLRANGLELFSYRVSIFGLRKSLAREGDEAWQPFNLVSHNLESDRPDGSPADLIYFAADDGGDSWCFFESYGDGYRVGKTGRHNFRPTTYWSDFGAWLLDEIESLEMLFDSDGVMTAKPPQEAIM